jgi:hypothetical protein
LAVEVFPHNQPTLHRSRSSASNARDFAERTIAATSGALWDVTVMGLLLAEDLADA